MEQQYKRRQPYGRDRWEGYVALAAHLAALAGEGRLSERMAARNMGRFLLVRRTRQPTGTAKQLIEVQEIHIPQACNDCPGLNACLSTHHKFWPASEYADPVGRAFRELPANKVLLPHCQHVKEHRRAALIPEKPDYETMVRAVVDAAMQLPVTLAEQVHVIVDDPSAA